jgi:hypothetical protein
VTAGGECFIEDGNRRSLEVLIVEVDDVTDRFRADAIGRERYHGHWQPQTIKAAPSFHHVPIRVECVARVK